MPIAGSFGHVPCARIVGYDRHCCFSRPAKRPHTRALHTGEDGDLHAPASAPPALSWAPLADPPRGGPIPVQTQRGVPMFRVPIPSDPCCACGGTGKTTCGTCRGKGRLNYRSASMLPKGAWPQWCSSCRASGKWFCERCMGTGARREPMGFRADSGPDG